MKRSRHFNIIKVYCIQEGRSSRLGSFSGTRAFHTWSPGCFCRILQVALVEAEASFSPIAVCCHCNLGITNWREKVSMFCSKILLYLRILISIVWRRVVKQNDQLYPKAGGRHHMTFLALAPSSWHTVMKRLLHSTGLVTHETSFSLSFFATYKNTQIFLILLNL